MKKFMTPTVLGAVFIGGLAVYLFNQKNGGLWSNASGGTRGGGSFSRQSCAVWRTPAGNYGSAGNGDSMPSGSVCMSKYA